MYRPGERPHVEVLVDGTWYPGVLVAWFPVGEGAWHGNVEYSTTPPEKQIGTFPGKRIRPVEH